MPTRLRGAAFRPQTACGPGNARSGARGLQGGAAGVGEYRGGGVRPRTAAGSEGPAGGASLPGPAEKAGTARPNTPFAARREVLRWAARPRGSGGRCAGTPPPCSPSAVRPGARRRPPARRGLTGPGPRSRPPAVPFSGPQRAGGRGLGRTDTAEGPGYLGGCWWLGSFPSRRGASGRGRGVQAQWDRGGGGGPRPRRAAGRPRRCRGTSGSSEGRSACSCGSLRIVLGQVQDGGTPCTGFPVTLAMGRTTKEEGGGCARSWRSPEEGGRGLAC